MRKSDKVSARPSFSPKYCYRAVAENAIKPFVVMYHEAMSIILGSEKVPNSLYFWAEYSFGVQNVLNFVDFWAVQKHTV